MLGPGGNHRWIPVLRDATLGPRAVAWRSGREASGGRQGPVGEVLGMGVLGKWRRGWGGVSGGAEAPPEYSGSGGMYLSAPGGVPGTILRILRIRRSRA